MMQLNPVDNKEFLHGMMVATRWRQRDNSEPTTGNIAGGARKKIFSSPSEILDAETGRKFLTEDQTGANLLWRHFPFQMNETPGSSASVALLEVINGFNPESFYSHEISDLVDYKLEKIQHIIYILFGIKMITIVLLMVYMFAFYYSS